MYYYTLLAIFAVIIYMMAVDENVAQWIWLQFQLISIKVRTVYFIITLGVRLRYDKWLLRRKLDKIRKDFNVD